MVPLVDNIVFHAFMHNCLSTTVYCSLWIHLPSALVGWDGEVCLVCDRYDDVLRLELLYIEMVGTTGGC